MTVWRHKSSKLNPTSVRKIRKLRMSGMSLRTIARLFGVSHNAIWLLEVGNSWRHVK
jgi:hypothetical protein